MGICDLAHIFGDLDLGHNRTVLPFHSNQLIHAAEHRFTSGGDQPLTNAEHVDLRALAQNILDNILIQRVRHGDLAIGPACFIQHLSCLAGQIGHIAGIQTNAALGQPLGLQHLIKDTDGIGYTGLQGVVGIHQQRGIIGIDLTIGFEGFIFRIEHLHPGMSHGAAGLHAEMLVGYGAGSAVTAADIGCSCAQNGSIGALCPAGAEFQNGSAIRSTNHTVGLGGDQALVIDGQQQIGFDQLGLNGRSPDGDDGFLGEHGRTLRHGPDIAGELEIAQIFQELLVKDVAATKIFDIRIVKVQVQDVINDLIQARGNGEATAIGTAAVEYIEIGNAVFVAIEEIAVAHGELIEIHQHCKIEFIIVSHDITSLI